MAEEYNKNLILTVTPCKFILNIVSHKSLTKNNEPKIISLKGKKDILGCSLEKASSNYIYIGRNINMGGWKLPKSKWANPYSVNQYGRDRALKLYNYYIVSTPFLYDSISELNGKILACWCFPEPCHGDILVELYKKIYMENNI